MDTPTPAAAYADGVRLVGTGANAGRIKRPLLLLFACLLLLPLQISNQSLWIDEGGTAFYALQPTFHAWVSHLAHDTIPNCQMPLSMLLAWVGAHSIGSAEWQFRVINLIWASGALIALYHVGNILRCEWLPGLLLVQPYFWFYADQARPYALEIFCGALLTLAVCLFWARQGQGILWSVLLGSGAVLLGYTTMLAPFPLFGVGTVCLIVARWKNWRIGGKSWLPLLVAGLLLIPAGLYYAWTIRRGVTFPVFWKGDWKAFCYVFYEFTGLLGLGPPVAEMREAAQAAGLWTFLRGHLPELSAAASACLCWLGFLALAVRRLIGDGKWLVFGLLVAIPILAGGTMTIVCLFMQKMLWARHWAPLFCFYITALGVALNEGIKHKTVFNRLLIYGWILLMLTSAVSLRFSAKHAKDDYRAAASLAQDYSSKGHTVYWAACLECAAYYGLPLHSPASASVMPFAYVPPAVPQTSNQSLAPVIFLSRPSIYDRRGLVREYLAHHNMSCNNHLCHAFTICSPND